MRPTLRLVTHEEPSPPSPREPVWFLPENVTVVVQDALFAATLIDADGRGLKVFHNYVEG